jgi:site-specific DNA-methyltransferase (adenine-specific)
VVTSPPYWGLRDFQVDGQLGLEATPEEYLARMVEVFREVRRVLRDDGTLFCNMGDAFDEKQLLGMPWRLAFALQADGWFLRSDIIWAKPNPMPESVTDRPTKAHEFIFLLSKQARYFYDGEAIREDVNGTAHKRQAMNGAPPSMAFKMQPAGMRNRNNPSFQSYMRDLPPDAGRNARSVWTIPSAPYPDAHFATFPPELARRCIVAGTSAKGCCAVCGAPWERDVATTYTPSNRGLPGGIGDARRNPATRSDLVSVRLDKHTETVGWSPTCTHDALSVPCTVLDPFAGSGTVGEVAEQNGRDAVLIELSPTYGDLIRERTAQMGLFASNGHAVSLE